MSKVFDSQVAHYKQKFHETKDKLTKEAVLSKAKSFGYDSADELKKALLDNNSNFRNFAFKYAGSLMPGRVSCTTYAAVVASVADAVGVAYDAKAGFCLQKSSPKYEKNLEDFKKQKAESSDEHPFFATHVYLLINGEEYEYYNGDTSNVDHIDVVSI